MASITVHQRAVQILLEVGLFPKLCKGLPDIRPSMPREAVPTILQFAIEANSALHPDEVSLFKTALSLEEPGAVWQRLSPEQEYFYDAIAFGLEDNSEFTARPNVPRIAEQEAVMAAA